MDGAGNGWIGLRGASGNNLRYIDVAIPRGLFTCVTGVSGSGKSTPIQDTRYPRLLYELHGTRTTWAPFYLATGIAFLLGFFEGSRSAR